MAMRALGFEPKKAPRLPGFETLRAAEAEAPVVQAPDRQNADTLRS